MIRLDTKLVINAPDDKMYQVMCYLEVLMERQEFMKRRKTVVREFCYPINPKIFGGYRSEDVWRAVLEKDYIELSYKERRPWSG